MVSSVSSGRQEEKGDIDAIVSRSVGADIDVQNLNTERVLGIQLSRRSSSGSEQSEVAM